MKAYAFPGMLLTPGPACSPETPQVSSGLQHPPCATNRVGLQEALCAGFGLTHECSRQLLSRPQGTQERSPKYS